MSYGQDSNLGITFQNSWDSVGDVGSLHFLPFISESIGKNIPPLVSNTMRGIHDEGDSFQGPHTNDGDIEVEAQAIPLGVLLKSVLELTATVTSDGIYTHTFKPRAADWDEVSANQPVTIYKYLQTGSAMRYTNMVGNTLELKVTNGEFTKAKVGFVGGGFDQIANTAATFPVGNLWTWDAASISFGGTAVDEIEELTITLDETIEAMHTLNNTLLPSRAKRTGFRSVAVDMTLKFDNQTEFQQFIAQSERELLVTMLGDSEIQSGYNEELTIRLPKMRYEEFKPVSTGPGEISVTTKARGKYRADSATSMWLTLVNTQSVY